MTEMSEQPVRGPLIQRQGYLKRAPSGKLSAFKRWEKKWCVFAISKRSGPILDFFDSRSNTSNGPAGAIGRVELKNTKQVCSAIQCKVAHTFIVVTEDRILSLAAQSQSDAESWIACLRRVLGNEGCLQSSEDHTYEVSGNAMTRQEQERLSRSRRRPPTPPGSPSSESSTTKDSIPLEQAPPPPVNRGQGSAPPLPRRGTTKEPRPPPVPVTERPKRTEHDFTPNRASVLGDTARNVLEVLMNYEESPDTTYESGDRQAICDASATLNARELDSALRAIGGPSNSRSSTLTPTSGVAPLYSKINKKKKGDNSNRPPVAPRRAQTLQTRIEHDFSPHIQAAGGEDDSDSDLSDSSGDEDMESLLAQLAQSKSRDLGEPDASVEDTYTTMDGFFDSPPPGLAANASAAYQDDDDERYVDSSAIRPPVRRLPSPEEVTSLPNIPDVVPKSPQSTPSRARAVAPGSPQIDNIYENSKTVTKADGETPKAVPTAAPRRVKTVISRQNRVPAPQPSARKPLNRFSTNDDTYENFLGEFGSGVSTRVTPKSHPKTSEVKMPPTPSSVKFATSQSFDNSLLPLPKTPVESGGSARTKVQPPRSRVNGTAAGSDIPLADVESAGSSLSSPDATRSTTKPAEANSSGRATDPGEELRQHLQSTAPSSILPPEEAPPPYTPPRILNDAHNAANMDCIAESPSDEEGAVADDPQPAVLHRHSTDSLEYDTHPAFSRQRPAAGKNAGVVSEIANTTRSNVKPGVSLPVEKLSPHTPPGTPPAHARRRSPTTHSPSTPPEGNVLRLEDSFPRMQKQSRGKTRTTYFEDVVPFSSSTADSRPGKAPLRRRFTVRSTSSQEPSNLAHVVPAKSASSENLQSGVAEYDHVIRERVKQGNPSRENLDSSSEEGVAIEMRRRPKKQDKQRRKSAPPNSLAVSSVVELAASKARESAQPASKPARERRQRQPLNGGTLVREGKVFKAPQRDSAANVPLKQAQTELLQEEIAHSPGVKVTVWRKDVKYALFVDIMNSIWVAGWNQKERPLLQNIFHIGDKVMSVNNEVFSSSAKLIKLIRHSDSDTKFEFVLRRLPFGKAYFVHRNLDYEDIGMGLKDKTAELVQIARGSLVAQLGLRINPNRAFGSGQCHWAVTEVNHRSLNIAATESEAQARLSAVGKDVSFVVQPLDFVELLKKSLKSSSRGWKEYVVG